MYDKDFKVKLISSKNSFIFLSEKDSRQLDHEHMIRLSYGLDKRAYFSLGTSLNSLKEGELAMCSILAKELGIIKSDIVTLSTTPYIANIRKLTLFTASEDDYEMLGVLAETVQSTLLNQVKIVHNQQKLVIWITNSLHVTVVVDGVEPISPGKLEMLTEVAILPPQKAPVSRPAANQSKRASVSQQKDSIMNAYNQTQCALRLLPIASLPPPPPLPLPPPPSITDKNAFIACAQQQPFSAFLSRRNFDRLAGSYRRGDAPPPMTLVTLRIVSPPSDIKELLDAQHEPVDSLTARLFCVDGGGGGVDEADAAQAAQNGQIGAQTPSPDALFVHATILEYFRARPGAKVLATPVKQKAFVPRSIDIVTTSAFFNRADELVRNYLCQYCQDGGRMLVNSGVVMTEDAAQCRFMLKFNPANEKHIVVDQRLMRECKFTLLDVELIERPYENLSDEGKTIDLCLDCCNYQEVLKGITKCLVKHDSSVILTGKTGSGKTCLTKKIAETLRAPPSHMHVEHVDCRKLKGKSIESLLKTINSIFLKLVYYQPAVLILDDLHVICEKVAEGDQPSQENLHFNKVSEMLSEELIHLLKNNRISLMASSESMAKLNQNIYSSRGTHLFKNSFSINELNKDDRITIMKYLLKKKETNVAQVDFNQLGVKTEGFLIQDLSDLVDKIIFEVYKKQSGLGLDNDVELVIKNEHCEIALNNASTLSLREVQLHSPGDRDFSDIGGLDDIKKVLVETMLWPAQYSNIFSHSPLRLQSGVLLYGPPGTGKTILAGAAAKQCNLRLISVKGPELLSKYIGASEQAVRDVFQKAQSVKPCILFFDEFDSLAPRRGHDNTGVTDRVVNQFLTQLDGVESLSGVCVLAATSRPDLLDPALLRPGRLDRQILCAMPNADSRLAILKSLSKKLQLSTDVTLERIVAQTEGFSGADLQAVLYTAQLNSVEHLLQGESTHNMQSDAESQLITQEHMQLAIKTTRPSLTREERAKYERIYQKFQGKSDILESLKSGKQKATLA